MTAPTRHLSVTDKIRIGGEIVSLEASCHSLSELSGEVERKRLERDEKRYLLEAVGSDERRQRAVEDLLRLCGIFLGDRDEAWLRRFDEIGSTEQLDAYRAFFFLPGPLLETQPKDIEKTRSDSHFYAGVSLWLCLRTLGHSAKAAPIMRRLGFSTYEPYATFSEHRFNTIRRLCEIRAEREALGHEGFIPLHYIPSETSPAGYWLLAEAALCRSRHKNAQSERVTSKDKAYRAQAQKIKSLDAVAKGKFEGRYQKTSDFDETLNLLECCIETDAARVAAEDSLFSEQWWKPYKRKLKAWNSHSRKLKAVGLQPVKPGSKLGSKHHKC